MTALYIIIGTISALMLSGAVCIVFKAGEKENICTYKEDEKQ